MNRAINALGIFLSVVVAIEITLFPIMWLVNRVFYRIDRPIVTSPSDLLIGFFGISVWVLVGAVLAWSQRRTSGREPLSFTAFWIRAWKGTKQVGLALGGCLLVIVAIAVVGGILTALFSSVRITTGGVIIVLLILLLIQNASKK